MMRTCASCLLFAVAVSVCSSARSAESALAKLQGEWSLVWMTTSGVDVPEENLKQTKVSVMGYELRIDKFWKVASKNPIDPVTKTAEGYLEGFPGYRYSLSRPRGGNGSAVDLILAGIIPAEEEADLKPEVKKMLDEGAVRNLGIYKLEGDKLTICFGDFSIDRGCTRPSEFTAVEHSNRVLLVFERKKAE